MEFQATYDFRNLVEYGAKKSPIFAMLSIISPSEVSGHNYFDVDLDEGTLSYFPGNRRSGYGVNEFEAKGRVSGTPPRLLRRMLPPELLDFLNDADFEYVSTLVKSFVERGKGTFEQVFAEDIPYWYHEDRMASGIPVGSLEASCLRHPHCQPWLNFHVSLKDHLSMLIYKNDEGDLLGRALVWEMADGTVFMDRIYGTDAMFEKFKDYAREQGWYHRAYQTYSDPDQWVAPNGQHCVMEWKITVPEWPEDGFPYMDSMRYLNLDDHTLTNIYNSTRHDATIQTTDGELSFLDKFTSRDEWRRSRYDRDAMSMARAIWDRRGEAAMAEAPTESAATATDPFASIGAMRVDDNNAYIRINPAGFEFPRRGFRDTYRW